MVWALPTMADTGTIEMPQNVNSVVMHIMCTNFVLLSQSEELVWYAAATSLFCNY